jgi:hypothetical protein
MNFLSKSILLWVVAGLAFLPMSRAQDAPKPFSKEELEQLVAPIALYPDALVAQILMASTYPLEVVEAARWSKANPGVKDKALEDAMQKQKWEASVKSLTAFPQVLAAMNEKLEVTQKLGDAFLGQQKEVMSAIQRLRGKADQAGNLKSGKEQTVTKTEESGQSVIKIEPANPQVVYVPTYNPATVYGPWPYPAYPPYYYYPYAPGAALFSFTVGVAVGSALWGGCNWGGNNVYINHNNYNNFNKTDIKTGDWNHKPENRKGVEYRDKGSQDKFGKGQRAGVDSREQFRGRAEQGRQDISRGAADNVKRDAGAGDRGGGAGDRSPGVSDRSAGAGDRSPGVSDRSAGAGDRSSGMSDRSSGMGDRAGGSSRQSGGFDGVGGGGGQTRDFSSRGASSRGSGGGGGSRGGGGGRRR